MSRTLLLLAIAISSNVSAQDIASPTAEDVRGMVTENREAFTEMVNAFSRCAGAYEVVAQINDASRQPANADNARGMAEGARLSAMYLLGYEYAATHEVAKAYGEFSEYVDAIAETRQTQLLAFIESGDLKAYEAAVVECVGLGELQAEIVQTMRDDSIGR